MRRSGDDDLVSISPPPAFRDLDTPSSPAVVSISGGSLVVPLPAPPQDFRDLTPSPGDPLLTFGLNPHSLPPIQSYHHGKTFIRKSVWDFADRVSLRIVSEAVVIATVLPEAGSSGVTDFRKGGHLGTGSYEEGALSASSSWEYLSPPQRVSQSDWDVDSRRDIELVVIRDEVRSSSSALLEGLSTSGQPPPPPLQCDTYSLPIDSISGSGQALPVKLRSAKHQRSQDLKRHSLQILTGNPDSRCSSSRHTGAESRHRSSEQNFPSGDSIGCNGSNRTSRWERNNNNENLEEMTIKDGEAVVGSTNRKSSQITGCDHDEKDSFGCKKKGRGLPFLNLFRKFRQKDHKSTSATHLIQSPRSDLLSISEFDLHRALPRPPMPAVPEPVMGFRSVEIRMSPGDVPASLQEVKDCGWYWGPLASEGAEDLLRGEPDGSFIVRDSSDPRYIFSLTFKLNGLIRHVRIEHDHGNFSFGPLTRFKASTIVDFVEKAVAHSRSGRYLFFLHRRPVLGPMRVQLLHPYSRFRHPRSLQHMSRFVILKHVRRDLVDMLGLPKPLVDYLNAPQYYFEPPPNH